MLNGMINSQVVTAALQRGTHAIIQNLRHQVIAFEIECNPRMMITQLLKMRRVRPVGIHRGKRSFWKCHFSIQIQNEYEVQSVHCLMPAETEDEMYPLAREIGSVQGYKRKKHQVREGSEVRETAQESKHLIQSRQCDIGPNRCRQYGLREFDGLKRLKYSGARALLAKIDNNTKDNVNPINIRLCVLAMDETSVMAVFMASQPFTMAGYRPI